MNTFNDKAKTWDSNPIHWERSEAIAKKIIETIPLKPEYKALEYGAGTGILSFILKDIFSTVTLMDTAIEMIKVIEEKIESTNAHHFKPLLCNLETSNYVDETFDLIYTQMVMHHVEDVKRMISKFYLMLNNGGSLAIADLYSEDGSFHGEGFQGHLGFDPEILKQMFTDAGFLNVIFEQCFTIKKQTESGITKEFPIFLISGKK